jgi:hypothetical protein
MQMSRMPTSFLTCALAASFAALVAASAVSLASPPSQVEVRFVSPVALADAGIDATLRAKQIERLEQDFSRELATRAARCLAQNQRLEIAIADFDAAGTTVGRRTSPRSETRVVKDGWSASIRLQYQLFEDQRVLRVGREQLRASGFVGDDPTARIQSEAYARERSMLTEWFDGTFCPVNASR